MTFEENVRSVLECNFAGFKDEVIDVACRNICRLLTYGAWIPCSERLPEEHGYYLVTTDGSRNAVIDIAEYGKFFRKPEYEFVWEWNKASKILAWMPLPEPYKADNPQMTSKDIEISYGREAGDCTRPYYIKLKRSDITVEEFTKYVMDELKSEWGYIRIYTRNEVKKWSADYEIEYSHGVCKSSEVIPPHVLDSCIKMVSGSGGWSRSDWDICI